MTRILITGGSGFLGQNIAPLLAQRHEVFAGFFTHPPEGISASTRIDVTRPDLLWREFRALKPDLVVHAASMARPDECQANPERARQVIVEGTAGVTRACNSLGCRLVFISTDLVFDGRRGYYTETDPTSGISVYADCKIQAEKVVRDNAPAATILRIALLYGRGTAAHPGQIELMLRPWRAGIPSTFFTDQYRTPLFAPVVADVVEALLLRPDFCGILHAGGGERVSRYEFAELVAERVQAPRGLLRPGSMWDSQAAAPRGADCSLVSKRLEAELGIRPMTCSEGLDVLLKTGDLRPLV